ncbi:MAG: hypothetical protein QOG55_2817 [Acidobacteriaceae bacterium]|nr:hypothetical protein [Acidobacteriaceae bacterium]
MTRDEDCSYDAARSIFSFDIRLFSPLEKPAALSH